MERIAKNVSAFVVKDLPVPCTIEQIRVLGKKALLLYYEDSFESFREGAAPLTDEKERDRLIAELNAVVALFYKLTFEEYQAVLNSFPIVEEAFKKKCLLEYNNCMFNASK